MINPDTKLFVFHEDNGTFVDHTQDAADLTRDQFNVHLLAAEDKLYLGYRKPFGAAFFQLEEGNGPGGEFTAEYYNGSSWQPLALTDETKNWLRSGFMFWEQTGMKQVEVNGVTAYFIRLTPALNHTNVVMRGVNLVFSSDDALVVEFPDAKNVNLIPAGQTSHILTHVAVRNQIIHEMSKAYSKARQGEQFVRRLDQWDFIDIFEIREAATYLALHKLFFNLADSPEDQWWEKSKEYFQKYEDKMAIARVSLDLNDDGVKDNSERQRVAQSVRWGR